MIENSMTLKEARALCSRYQHLMGQTVKVDNEPCTIECVAVGPMDDLNRYIFLEHYKSYKDPKQALEFYKVPFYNVLLIGTTNSGAVRYWDIHAHLTNTGEQVIS